MSTSKSSPLDRFIAGGFFVIIGLYALPQSWQAGSLLFGFGIVLLMSVDKEKMNRFIDFFWGLFTRGIGSLSQQT